MKNDAMQRPVPGADLSSIIFCVTVLIAGLPSRGRAQVNTGSNGSDGAFHPTTSININMASRPSGIYQYTSVNIPSSVTVTFIPNANNTPVVWLVQSNCTIAGSINLSGQDGNWCPSCGGGAGGPGGGRGGVGGSYPTPGEGPGGGGACATNNGAGGSFGSQGQSPGGFAVAGAIYGNSFLLPLLCGSGGGGASGASDKRGFAGGGGGGAILIAASGSIQLNGDISVSGGSGGSYYSSGSGGGSGGGVRLVATSFGGSGSVTASGGYSMGYLNGGKGRIRIDAYQSTFGGTLNGVVSQGFQPVVLQAPGQGAQLAISSIAGVAVSASPTGVLTIPDAVISAQQANPIPVVVSCTGIPLGAAITVSVRPASGASVTAVGHNTA
ncbi:MAG: hypothetical protein NT154_24645, partial [Verrucomicrobia bacterium]|nr:hypothetical protein [Verrucomicrobiota bacterium]